jgi:CHASE2 domain-containing sensor protein
METWQKFISFAAGDWILERISQRFPKCKQLINQGQRHKFGGKYRHWVMIFLLGLVIAPAFTYLEQYPVVMDVQDAVGIDGLMRATQQNIPSAQPKNIPQFVWLDIDDNTHEQWGEPLFTPRNRIERLIDTAVKAQARLIIVDIDLSRPTPIEGLEEYNIKRHPYDKSLANYFATYSAYCKTQPKCPPIILARTFLNGSNDTTKLPPFKQPRLAFSELEQAVINSDAHIQWATPQFQLSRDGVLRRRLNWQATCTGEQPGVLASVEVTAAVLLNSETPKQAQDIITKALSPLKPDCTGAQSKQPPKEIEIASLKLSTDPLSVRQRIVFSMPWLITDPNTGKSEPWIMLKDETDKFSIVKRLPVHNLQNIPPEYLKKEHLEGDIVIIGGSHSDGRDHHQTPLGSMPGALVLINSTHSLLQYEQIEPLPNWAKCLVIAVLISVMAWIFIYVGSFWLAQILNLLIIGSMMFISVLLFRSSGFWLDFATPLIFVQLYQIAVFLVLALLCLLLSVGQWLRRMFLLAWQRVQRLFNGFYVFVKGLK